MNQWEHIMSGTPVVHTEIKRVFGWSRSAVIREQMRWKALQWCSCTEAGEHNTSCLQYKPQTNTSPHFGEFVLQTALLRSSQTPGRIYNTCIILTQYVTIACTVLNKRLHMDHCNTVCVITGMIYYCSCAWCSSPAHSLDFKHLLRILRLSNVERLILRSVFTRWGHWRTHIQLLQKMNTFTDAPEGNTMYNDVYIHILFSFSTAVQNLLVFPRRQNKSFTPIVQFEKITPPTQSSINKTVHNCIPAYNSYKIFWVWI